MGLPNEPAILVQVCIPRNISMYSSNTYKNIMDTEENHIMIKELIF